MIFIDSFWLMTRYIGSDFLDSTWFRFKFTCFRLYKFRRKKNESYNLKTTKERLFTI